KIKCLSIKAKGKAQVLWEEDYGLYLDETYRAKYEYFSIEQCVLQEGNDKCDGFVVLQYHPVFLRDMPSSFQGKCGQILYSLEAKLTRSMRFDTKAKTDFPFVSKANQSMIPYLMKPQHGTKDKDVMFFASGKISVSIHTERQGYQQGDALKVRAIIVNNSTRPVTPKYYLYEKQCFYAQKKRKVHTHNILKEKGDRVPAETRQTVTQVLTIPPQLPATIFNCPILKLEYRLKVATYISCTFKYIMLPIILSIKHPSSTGSDPPFAFRTA
uniref:Arrestin C-terminal-like domain-containing protein n=1 Tax=Oncorhynchus kisutch TaxID=8019 RepID=A0A8C7CPV0_ONCKI